MSSDTNSMALDSSQILLNYGGTQNNDFSRHLDDVPAHDVFIPSCSLYYNCENIHTILKQSGNSLSVLSMNIQSAHAKIAQFQAFIQGLEKQGTYFDVLCIQESWADVSTNYNLLTIDGYKMFTKDSSQMCSTHGGLITYVRNDISTFQISKAETFTTWEGLFVELGLENNKKITIANIYRPPTTTERTTVTFFSGIHS